MLYFRADDKYTVVQTATREYLIRTPLKELLPQLDPELFWQIHRNTLVNTRAVASARRELTGRVTLALHQRPETLTVSRAYAHRFRGIKKPPPGYPMRRLARPRRAPRGILEEGGERQVGILGGTRRRSRGRSGTPCRPCYPGSTNLPPTCQM